LSDAESIAFGDSYFTNIGPDLSAGDYADAAYADTYGSLGDLAALQVLFEGVVASF
jgi:hypothetical protein